MRVEDILPKKDIESINEDIRNLTKLRAGFELRNINVPTQSDPFQHKNPVYEPLCEKVIELCKKYLTDSSYLYEELEITNMWLNFSKAGDVHRTHNHSNNIFSGVWYPFSNSQTSIYFYDPRAVANFWLPNKKENNIINSSGWSMPNKQNLGLIFPSWLYHSVPPADGERISLSWNIILRGEYGEPNTLQNAHI